MQITVIKKDEIILKATVIITIKDELFEIP